MTMMSRLCCPRGLENSFSTQIYRHSFTTSIESSIKDFRIENGRTYHKYKDGRESKLDYHGKLFKLTLSEYAYPNDEVG